MRTVSPAEMEELPELDRAGFFPAPGETAEEFRKRVRKIRRVFSDFDKELRNGTAEFDGLKLSAAGSVPDEFVRDAGEVTEALYGFQIRHVPGFFLSRGVGLLWGGCKDLRTMFRLLRDGAHSEDDGFVSDKKD